MRLEDVSAVIRPRGKWEAVDLGFAMTRRHFPLLLGSWMLTVVPLWIVLLFLSQWITIGWSLILIWWLKPIYERVPLFILSRSLFGAVPKMKAVLREWPKMLISRLPYILFFRIPWLIIVPHFSWSRALTLPALDLEQQKGRALSDRQQVLMRLAGSATGWLTIVCGLLEMCIVFGLLTFAAASDGTYSGASELWEAFIDAAFRKGELSPLLQWSLISAYLIALTFVELFYIGGGFGLYLNCRTHLEGWDVEIMFRRIARRFQKAAVIALLAALCSSASAIEIEKNQSEAKATVRKVLEHEDFKIHKVKQRKYESDSDLDFAKPDGSWLQGIGQFLYYAIIVAAVAFLVWLIYKNRHLFQRGLAPTKPARDQGPRTVIGMDVAPESLPDDIIAAARVRWAAGDARGALSLLYRGSLSWLVHKAKLPVQEGDTEGDCVRKTRRAGIDSGRCEYFNELTGQWVLVAYGEKAPASALIDRLLDKWPFRDEGSVK